jgi:hypothetical protein
MAYSEEELMNAGRQLAGAIKGLTGRLEALEGKPFQDAFNQEWSAGQRYARQKGYGAEDLARLEQDMVEKGVSRHIDAVALDSSRPATMRGALLGGLPADEMALAMSGKLDEFERLAISRARRGE